MIQELRRYARNEPFAIGMDTTKALLEHSSIYEGLLEHFKKSLPNKGAWNQFQSDVIKIP